MTDEEQNVCVNQGESTVHVYFCDVLCFPSFVSLHALLAYMCGLFVCLFVYLFIIFCTLVFFEDLDNSISHTVPFKSLRYF